MNNNNNNNINKISILSGHTDRVWHVAWDPNGLLLASSSGDKTIRIWSRLSINTNIWYCKAVLEEAQSRTIRSCEWSPSGKYLAAASFDGTIVIWSKTEILDDDNNNNNINKQEEYEIIYTLEGHESEVKSISWSYDEMYIATCSRDKSIWLWDGNKINDFECISVLHGHLQDIKFVKWHKNINILFSTSYDDTIRIWMETEDDWECNEILKGHESTVWGIAFNPNGKKMASVSDDCTIIIWETRDENYTNWKRISTITGYHNRTILTIDWSKYNNIILTGSTDDTIRLFKESNERNNNNNNNNISYIQIYSKEKAHLPDVNCVRWNPNKEFSSIFASAGDDGNVKIWEYIE